MDTFKKAVSSIKDRIVKSPLERSVLEVCSDENWGSANTALHEISEKTFNHEDRQVIMKLIWELLKSPAKEWRRLYKVLNLLDHLIKFGSTACLHEIQDEAFKIRMLQDFSFREGAEEKGIGVRDKAKYISSMLADRKVLEEEREKAKKTWSKFTGISAGDSYGRDNWRGNYDSYNERRADDGYQGGRTGGMQERRFDDRREERVQEERRNESYEVKDIFKEPEIKVVKLNQKETVWDKEPGKLPSAPKGIRPPPSSTNPSNIFDPVQVKKVSEVKPPVYDPNSPFTASPSFPATHPYSPNPQPIQTPSPISFPAAPVLSFTASATSPYQPSPYPSAPIQSVPMQAAPMNPVPSPSIPVQTFNPTNISIGSGYPGGSYMSPVNPVNPVNPVGSPNLPAPTYPNTLPNFNNGNLTGNAPNTVYPGTAQRNPAPTYNPVNFSGPGFTQPLPSMASGPSTYPASTGGYTSQGSNAGLMGLNFGQPDYSGHASSTTSSTSGSSGLRVHANLSGGFSMEDMKKLGNSGFSNFQSAPAEPAKVDLESKLINLDNLEAGQPRLKEVAKSRW